MSSTVESLKKRADKLAEQDGGNIVLIFKNQEQVLNEMWPSWEKDAEGMSTEEILEDPRYRAYEKRHYEIITAETRAAGNIPIILDEEDRDL